MGRRRSPTVERPSRRPEEMAEFGAFGAWADQRRKGRSAGRGKWRCCCCRRRLLLPCLSLFLPLFLLCSHVTPPRSSSLFHLLLVILRVSSPAPLMPSLVHLTRLLVVSAAQAPLRHPLLLPSLSADRLIFPLTVFALHLRHRVVMGYWLPVAEYNVNRFFVIVSAIALIVRTAHTPPLPLPSALSLCPSAPPSAFAADVSPRTSSLCFRSSLPSASMRAALPVTWSAVRQRGHSPSHTSAPLPHVLRATGAPLAAASPFSSSLCLTAVVRWSVQIVNAVILAFAALGLLGALSTDIRWLQLVTITNQHA